MKILNLQDNGEDCVAWRWTWEIDFEDGNPTRSYATNAQGNGLFDCCDEYKQLKGNGQFSLAGKTVPQARQYIQSVWRK